MKRSDKISFKGGFVADVMAWLVPLLLLVPNIILDFTEIHYTFCERAINILLPGGVYLMLFGAGRRVGATTLWFLPIMILCAFQIVLLFLYGESIIAIDMFLNVLTTNYHEATELLRNLSEAIIVVCALYLPPIIAAVVLCVKGIHADKRMRRLALGVGGVLALAGVVFWLCCDTYRPTRRLFPVNVISNMAMAVDRAEETEAYREQSADFSFDAKCESPDSACVFVLVIGETSRADNWQLNGYGRDTNPLLSQRRGLVSFSKALSESNTTHKSVPLLMSHLEAASFGDSISCVKGVIDTFKEAGFATAWFSNQKRNGALIDFFGEQADTIKFITDDGAEHYDGELCPYLEGFLSSNPNRRLFAVLHTYGCHFNYKERYPSAFRHFTPEGSSEAEASNREGLINSYDNAIRYTDMTLDSIAGILASSGRPAAMIYLADHGEDIFDDERGRFLHASPTPTYWQIHVPMIVWLSDAYRSKHGDKYTGLVANTGKNVSSSQSAFHTIVSLAGVETRYFREDADLSSSGYKEPGRVFLNDYNEAVELRESGLRQPDYDELKAHRISY